jgi:hypothetical protein
MTREGLSSLVGLSEPLKVGAYVAANLLPTNNS